MSLLVIVVRRLQVKRRRSALFLGMIASSIAIVLTINAISLGMRSAFLSDAVTTGNRFEVSVRPARSALTYRGIVVGRAMRTDASPIPEAVITSIRERSGELRILNIVPARIDIVPFGEAPGILVSADLDAMKTMRPWWRVGGTIPTEPGGLLLGNRFAEVSGAEPGDVISVAGEPRIVRGVIEPTGSADDRVAFIESERVDRVDVLWIESLMPEPTAISEVIERVVPVGTDRVVVSLSDAGTPLRYRFFASFARYAGLLSSVLGVLGAFLLYVFGMTSIAGRSGEFAVFRSMGYRKSKIVVMVATELAVFGIAAVAIANLSMIAVIAVLSGTGVLEGFLFSRVPIFRLFGASLIITTGATVVAGIRPALRAARIDVMSGLRLI